MAKRIAREKKSRDVRLAHIELKAYKSIDELAIDLPSPRSADEIDAFVLGSKNGVGKSSVLEACTIGMLNAFFPRLIQRDRGPRGREYFNPYDLLIRSGSEIAIIASQIEFDKQLDTSEVRITRDGFMPAQPSSRLSKAFDHRSLDDPRFFPSEEWLPRLLGMSSEPLVVAPVLLFHSYRKVQEGNSALAAMVDPDAAFVRRRGFYTELGPLSTFKVVLVRALMAKSGLFEGVQPHTNDILEKLNGLMTEFAQGRVDKLRPGPDGTLELRVAPIGGGESYSFDGLSSGQKEIIATLFLIWYTTHERPSVVLIDEPELHLNAEWQRLFVRTLASLAPQNQYILATHSEEIFSSVPQERRMMLQRG